MEGYEKQINDLLENYGIENSTKENLAKDITLILKAEIRKERLSKPETHEYDPSDLFF